MRRMASGLGSLAILVAGVAFAAEPAVVANMTAVKVVAKAGKETLTSADSAQPGDVIEYRVDYHNASSSGVGNVIATLPVPANGVEYILGTDAPRGATASVDGKTFSTIPLMRTVKLANGQTTMQPVPFSEYRYLRWSLGDLPAEAHKRVSARVRLLATPASANTNSKPVGNF